MAFSVTSTDVSSVIVLRLQGDLDIHFAPRLEEEIGNHLSAGRFLVVLDLAEVSYVDSTGLGVMIGALKKLQAAGGGLVLAAPTTRILRVLQVTGLDGIFCVRQSVEDAVRVLHKPTP